MYSDFHAMNQARRVASELKTGPKNTVLLALLLGFVVFMGTAQAAETMKLLGNGCAYVPELNRDSCWSTYEYCLDGSATLKKGDVTLKFAKTGDKVYSDTLKDVSALKDIQDSTKPGCSKIYVTGLKMPTATVDNVPCVKDKCWPEYAWWNATFANKIRYYGYVPSVMTANTTMLVYANFTISGKLQNVFCNWTVGTTNDTIGYIYYNTYSDYICINAKETTAVSTIVEYGNGTKYTNGLDQSLIAFWPLSSVEDMGIYGNNLTHAGTVDYGAAVTAFGTTYDNAADYSSSAGTPLKQIAGNISFAFWIYDGALTVAYETPLSRGAWTPGFWGIRKGDLGASDDKLYMDIEDGASINTVGEIQDSVWHHIVGVWKNDTTTSLTIYVDGIQNATGGSGSYHMGVSTASTFIAKNNGATRPWSGSIDNVMIFNKTLSANEIYLLYYSQKNAFTFDNVETIVPVVVISFVPPTDNNTKTVHNYTYVNITTDTGASSCRVAFNGTNFTMANLTPLNWFVNLTALGNGNYTYYASCANSAGNWSDSIVLWTYANYTAPPWSNPFGIIYQCDFCKEMPVKQEYCSGTYLVTLKEKISCFEGFCTTANAIEQKYCQYGCNAWTLSTLGYPGCAESPLLYYIIIIAIVIVVSIFIRWAMQK
jgi:hypothetical protein